MILDFCRILRYLLAHFKFWQELMIIGVGFLGGQNLVKLVHFFFNLSMFFQLTKSHVHE